jgi:uncharacterized protein (TIGR00369 family)
MSGSSAPIAAWLGFSATQDSDGRLYRLAFNETHIGNPAIRALHGGVIAAFLELAMQTDLRATGSAPTGTVNVAIDYISSSRAEDMTARVKVIRVGRRLAFLEAEGRQGGGTRLVAVARACLKLG